MTENVTTGDGYLLDNQDEAAGERLGALSAIFDRPTFRHLEELGVGPGWRCWEVGAGGPSVPGWLAERVAPEGHVLATDIDVSRLSDVSRPTFEVRRHDVAVDDPPAGPFDLIHARLVLVHLAERDEALRRMVSVLRPGGWLVVEDADPGLQPLSCLDEAGPEDELANKVRRGFRTLLAQRGADLGYGRKLPRLLRAAGLLDVAADAYLPVALPACRLLETATVTAVRNGLLAQRLATVEEIERHLANVASGRLDLAQPPMVKAWGRRR